MDSSASRSLASKSVTDTVEEAMPVKSSLEPVTIDAAGLHYRKLNEKVKDAVSRGVSAIKILNVNGQRYLGTGINSSVTIYVQGTPGSDLGAFMNGPKITVDGNSQDAVGNTMGDGEIVIHGHAGDVTGYAMRGGKVFVKGDVGYRVGIHMKSFRGKDPVLVVGGAAHDFLGEYMAGGILIVLRLGSDEDVPSNYIGTGMHGGVIYLRGGIKEYQLGKEVSPLPLDDKDREVLDRYVREFSGHFGFKAQAILKSKFVKLLPLTHRPYGRLYAY